MPGNSGNTVSNLEPGKAYWIKCYANISINIQGAKAATSVSINSGWNLVGFNLIESREVAIALDSISNKYISVWQFASGIWKTYNSSNPGLSDLSTMDPGYGYWINASENCTWTLDAKANAAQAITGLKKSLVKFLENKTAIVSAAVPPMPARIGGTLTVNGTLLTQAISAGYTITVKKSSNTALVSADGLNSSGFYIADIPTYEASTQPDGVNPGDTVIIHVYKNGSELNVSSPANGSIQVGENGSITTINIETATSMTTTTQSATTTTTAEPATATTTTEPATTTTTAELATTTTTVELATTTTTAEPTTTTVPNKLCPAKKALGENNSRLENLRDFRDSTLAQTAIGREITQIYYRNAGSINAALDRSPVLQAMARRFFETASSLVGKKNRIEE